MASGLLEIQSPIYAPYLEIIFKNDVNMAAGLAKWLDLDQEMVAYLVGGEEKAKPILEMLA
jgi:hypothetical protein